MTDTDTPTTEAAEFHFDAADDALRGVLDAAGPAIAGESPCPDWTGTDVLHHLIDTERSFMEKVGFDLGPAPAGEGADRPVVGPRRPAPAPAGETGRARHPVLDPDGRLHGRRDDGA